MSANPTNADLNQVPGFASKRKSGQRTGRSQYVDVTFGSPNVDTNIALTLGHLPTLYEVVRKAAACDVYDGTNGGTDWTSQKIVLRGTAATTVTLRVT